MFLPPQVEKKFLLLFNCVNYKEDILMTGWSFFFVLVGVVFLTAQLFRVIDAIERPNRHPRRRAVAR